MRTILISGVAILLSTAAFPAAAVPAASDTATSQDSQTGAPADGTNQPRQRARASDRQICVNEAMSTGRIRRRVCHTQAEWDRLQGSDDQ
jgi:hypothetical protein